jgi:hypothetical protein
LRAELRGMETVGVPAAQPSFSSIFITVFFLFVENHRHHQHKKRRCQRVSGIIPQTSLGARGSLPKTGRRRQTAGHEKRNRQQQYRWQLRGMPLQRLLIQCGCCSAAREDQTRHLRAVDVRTLLALVPSGAFCLVVVQVPVLDTSMHLKQTYRTSNGNNEKNHANTQPRRNLRSNPP